MAFKVGDRVKAIREDSRLGSGKVVETGNKNIGVEFDTFDSGHDCNGNASKNHGWYVLEFNLKLVGEPLPTKFIAIYDEEDGDPAREFGSEKELMEWLNDLPKEVIKSSVRVFSVSGEFKPNFSTTLEKVGETKPNVFKVEKRKVGRPKKK